MTKIIYILFISGLMISCDGYQQDPINLTNPTQIRAGAGADDILNETTNGNSFELNMQNFLDFSVETIEGEETDTLIDYDKLYETRNDAENVELRRNLYTQIAKTNLDELEQNEKVAFLINTYNFLAIETVVNNYITEDGSKLKSITDIGGESSFSAFSSIEYKVAGQMMTLDKVEKGTLKPLVTFSTQPLKIDARFHFAVICSAKGCPILLKQAYTSENLDDLLDLATKEGLKLARNLQARPNATLVTSLFDWYVDDFIHHTKDSSLPIAGSEKQFINQFLPEVQLNGRIEYIDYDWSLNKI